MKQWIPAASLLLATSAHAGGLNVPGYGTQAQPRAGAFTAKADDPSAVFLNPAGLAKQKGTSIHIGFNWLNLSQSFQREGSYDSTDDNRPFEGQPFPKVSDQSKPIGLAGYQAIPLIAVSTDFGWSLPLRIGFGLGAGSNVYPNRSYASSYQLEATPNEAPPPQRYDLLDQEVVAMFGLLSAAYRVTDKLDIGVSVGGGMVHVKGRSSLWAIPNYSESEGGDAVFDADVRDDFVPKFVLGALFRPIPELEFGAYYKNQQNVNAKGDGLAVLGSKATEIIDTLDPIADSSRCAPGGTVVRLKTCLDLVFPREVGLGARWVFRDDDGKERGDLELDVVWEQWSKSDDILITVDARTPLIPLFPVSGLHGMKDVWSIRAGGAYSVDVADNPLWLRAGLAYDTEAAPASWNRLDVDTFPRTTIGLGLGYEFGRYRFDIGGGAVLEGKRVAGPLCNPTASDVGCTGEGQDQPQDQRQSPDPRQPTTSQTRQVQSPYNAGVYEQSYIQFSTGITATF